jgi:hypothetical protein
MRLIFSRKGFDSSSGGAPSPIVAGRPVSLPIPASGNSRTTYGHLGLGELVRDATGARLGANNLCHADPWFNDGMCAFGQTGSAQGHLANNNIGVGDVFLFFGLFTDEASGEPHHRIFGYMRIEQVLALGPDPDPALIPAFALDHPHFIGTRDRNNTLYLGPGRTCSRALPSLRLTQTGGPLCTWDVPSWLETYGLTYHGAPWRWSTPGKLMTVSRGQEFVTDIGRDPIALEWLHDVIEAIEEPAPSKCGDAAHDDHGEIILTVLRQPRTDDPAEQRSEPFWEFGSFGITGCHGRNLLHPRRAHELEGKRLAFAQGGPDGFRLVHLTPPVKVQNRGAVCEVAWAPALMPFKYATAPLLINNAGETATPSLICELEGVARHTWSGRFASKFRSRREPVSPDLAAELEHCMRQAAQDRLPIASSYVDALPHPPPSVDLERRKTYTDLLRSAGGSSGFRCRRKKPRVGVSLDEMQPRQRKC